MTDFTREDLLGRLNRLQRVFGLLSRIRKEVASVRELTFKGFLTQYVKNLSKQNTNSLYKLASEAGTNNPRLAEPLLLYALFSGKQVLLLRATKDTELHKNYLSILQYSADTMLKLLEGNSEKLNANYHKVWNSFLHCRNRLESDNHTKELIRQKVKRLQEKSGLSNYRIYTDLKLNPGNLNAWLKHGNCAKVSLETARQTLRYVERTAN